MTRLCRQASPSTASDEPHPRQVNLKPRYMSQRTAACAVMCLHAEAVCLLLPACTRLC